MEASGLAFQASAENDADEHHPQGEDEEEEFKNPLSEEHARFTRSHVARLSAAADAPLESPRNKINNKD
jgi:hypothetical protein